MYTNAKKKYFLFFDEFKKLSNDSRYNYSVLHKIKFYKKTIFSTSP